MAATRSPDLSVATNTSLELRHLQALVAVAEMGSFSRAGGRLGYSQSAVSQQIAALERVIGQPVFDRPGGPRPVTLTAAGALLLERSSEILAKVRVALTDLESLRAGQRGTVRLGTFQSVSQRVAPQIIARLRHERPGTEVVLHESEDQDDLLARLVGGELDLSFLVSGPGNSAQVNAATAGPVGLCFEELFHDPYLVLVPAGEQDGPIRASELARRPLIGQHDHICQLLVDDALRANGVEPNYAFHTSDNGAVHAMVSNGMGLAVMPRLAIDADDPTVRAHPLDPPVPDRHVLLGWREGSTSPLIPALVGLAHTVVEELGLAG